MKGVDRFTYAKAIPIVILKTDIKDSTYAKMYEPGSDPKWQLLLLEVANAEKGK